MGEAHRRNRHLFVVSLELMKSASHSLEEIRATCRDLEEMGLYKLPYSPITLRIEMVNGATCDIELVDGGVDERTPATYVTKFRGTTKITPGRQTMFRGILIALLATRNIAKDVTRDKRAALGLGRGKYASTTVLRLPLELRTSRADGGEGVHKRPHLRRGHIRRQRSGPNLTVENKIWIAPMLINLDAPEPDMPPKEYRLSKSAS